MSHFRVSTGFLNKKAQLFKRILVTDNLRSQKTVKNQVRSLKKMIKSGWCRANYHSDGKRRLKKSRERFGLCRFGL